MPAAVMMMGGLLIVEAEVLQVYNRFRGTYDTIELRDTQTGLIWSVILGPVTRKPSTFHQKTQKTLQKNCF